MAGDVYVSFGADTGELEAAFAVAKAETNALAKEMRDLAKEMQATGASMESALGQQLTAAANKMAAAKAEIAKIKAEMKGGEGEEAAGVGGIVKGLQEGLEGALGPLAAVKAGLGEMIELIAVAFAVEAIHEFIESMAQLGTQTKIASALLGISTDEIGGFNLMAKASGVGAEELQQSFARLSRSLIDQSPNAKRALDALGLSFNQLRDEGPQEQLDILAEKFAHIEDGATKDAIAMALFGRAGIQMIPMLNEGKSGMEEWAQVARETGTALNENTVAGMEAAHHALTTMDAAIQGDGISVFNEFRSVLIGAVKYVSDLAQNFSEATKTSGLLRDALDQLKLGLQVIESAIVGVTAIVRGMWTAIETAVQAGSDAFRQMGSVIRDVFVGIGTGIGQFFSNMINVANSAASIVGQEYMNLGLVVLNGVTGHFAEASAAFNKMGTDAKETANTIRNGFSSALSGFDFSKADADIAGLMGRQKAIIAIGVEDEKKVIKQGQDEIDTIWKQSYGKEEAEAEKHAANMAAANAGKGAKDALNAARQAAEQEIQLAEETTREKIKRYDDDLSHKRITSAQYLAETVAALNEELSAIKASYDKELTLAGLNAAQKAQIRRQEALEVQKIEDQILDVERKAADATEKTWQDAANTVEGAFNSQLRGLLAGTTSWSAAMKNIAADLTIKFIEEAEKMTVQWIIHEAMRTTASEAGATARTTAEAGAGAAGLAIQAGSIIKSIISSAAETFAGVFGFLSPVLGPAAAGPAAAASGTVLGAVGSVASADIGMYNVPQDQLAMIHKNELIMPAGQAGAFRSILDGLSGKGGGGGAVHNHTWNITGGSDPHATARAVAQMWKSNPSLRPVGY